jgi:plasmid stabilization system protein ParE
MDATRKKRLEWHPEAIAEFAESLAWYAERNPSATRRMRREIEAAALSLIANPLPFPVAWASLRARGNCRSVRILHSR